MGNGIYTYKTGSGYREETHYYVKIGDQWYCAYGDITGNKADTYEIKLQCSHRHDDNCYTCGLPEGEHVHSVENGCYKLVCQETEHTHSADCYIYQMDPALWELVDPGSITVAGDGSSILNVKYNRKTFALTFKIPNGRSWNNAAVFNNIKWGEDTTKYWNQAPTGYRWCTDSGTTTAYTYAPAMPANNLTVYGQKVDSRYKYTIHYYEENTTQKLKEDNVYYRSSDGYYLTDEDYVAIPGFTCLNSGKTQADKNLEYRIYYRRNSYQLKFYSYGLLEEKTKTLKYEEKLEGYYIVPDYPTSSLEENAYEFAGWYTSQQCVPGTEVNWKTMKMPALDKNAALILYAKWTPKTHTVRTWLTNEMKTPVNVVGDSNVQTVSHGSLAQKPEDPTNGKYNFVGWFYKEDGKEKAFDFSMQVRKDLELYAKWTADALVEYTIRYQTEDGVDVAQPTVGKALAGADKTFTAKGGDELFESFQTGFFPKVSSHSLNMSIDGVNEYIFVYVQREKVPYTVRYLTDAGENLFPDEEKESSNAIVTENFKPKSGWIPDEPQKRIVLEADGENVITFVYHRDDENAFVQVIYWFQNIVGEDYTESPQKSYIEKIGSEITEEAKAFEGFQYNEEKSNNSGTLTSEGLVLNLYYDRIEYPYLFKFVDEEGNEIIESEEGKARFGRTIDQRAKEVPGYTLESDEVQSIKIAIEDPADTAKKNVKIFYYKLALADLTITKKGCEAIDKNQSFVFTVTGGDLGTDGIQVTIQGNDSVTITGLKVGTEYTVTEKTDWSWRYTPMKDNAEEKTQQITLQAEVNGVMNEVTFTNDRTNGQWLNGCSIAVNFWESKEKITRKETPNTTTTN